ncbi:hypothetical protein JTE78_12365 [Pseudomonas syringae pv. aptata]|uniref:hypothetical protein n=1 Tax=Pseudomonas syringae TaxID=317 RepID=UPI00203AE69E|nr:hypothetical protein [Pseudomonas syringae]MCK0543556.1 hypothetical protein [Pseudomonas syringae pv. aptata]
MSETTRAVIGMPFEMAMENDLSRRQFQSRAQALLAECDRLSSENAGLKTGYEAYERVNAELRAECEKLKVDLRDAKDAALGLRWAVGELKAENEALRKDKDRLDALDGNFWDVRHSSGSLADAGDYTSGVEVVGHWMEKPFERVIGENYTENLRAAIDQAMAADAYPPARPEYPEIDAAMSKEQSHD